GAIAICLADMVRYYMTEARAWERQVLIRSRSCAGDVELFKTFFAEVEDLVFSKKETVETALANVRRSKEQIDLEQVNRRGFDVKLGRGGIREIEFLAQALQLAHGGRDKWLRSPHTLISLVRLTDRKHLTETDLTELTTAYTFLRRTEHMLQMENGVQTHTVPEDAEKRELLARRMSFAEGGNFEKGLAKYTANVSRIFTKVFGEVQEIPDDIHTTRDVPTASERSRSHVLASIKKSDIDFDPSGKNVTVLDRVSEVSPHFASMLAANPHLVADLPDPEGEFHEPDYAEQMMASVESVRDFGQRLSAMRRTWSSFLLQIVVLDIFEKITITEAKRLQTNLAEASIAAALRVVRDELAIRTGNIGRPAPLDLAVLALGKLGGRGIDYDSDLDLVIVYYDPQDIMAEITPGEFYSRAVELFVTTLSSMTRDGSLYRVDLRLRPFGSKGMSAMSIDAFLGYMTETAAVWEMLAFVKLRMVGGDASIGLNVENETRRLIHERAAALPADELREETLRVRLALESQRVRTRRGGDIDIKYGSGGMLDVYFAMRFLQLRDNVPDEEVEERRSEGGQENGRSTSFMLAQLAANGSLSGEIYAELLAGYNFLSDLDHTLRLTIGRTTRVPLGNENALKTIAARMGLVSPADLIEQLTLHRLAIRATFESILSS
ncbi:MAG: hypothetical protein KA831_07775, partial [Pyrinomonadaceae bacterium]|nr:hypothetical protein [Pyrinomonadaceae bacterium]